MGLERALRRFDDVVAHRSPAWSSALRAGLDDAGIERLRSAVAPCLLPPQVEALYRWRDGSDLGVFGGWRMRSSSQLVEWYRFTCEELGSPRTWLPVFDDQMVSVVTLDLPGLAPSDRSVWHGHTHDVELWRLFDSIEALVDVVCDAAEAGALHERDGRVGMLSDGHLDPLDGGAWQELRTARSPGSYRAPDPPPGTCLSSVPDPDWPQEWLLPLGVTQDSLALRGATCTVAELVATGGDVPVQGTVRGRVVTAAFVGGWWCPVVSDGTAELVVVCDTRLVPLVVGAGRTGEFDVVLQPAGATDEHAAAITAAGLAHPSRRTARGLAARPVPD